MLYKGTGKSDMEQKKELQLFLKQYLNAESVCKKKGKPIVPFQRDETGIVIRRRGKRKMQTRDLVMIAVLSAITVAGRAAFYMLPNFKPVAAMVIICGVTLGAKSGFLVGCISMLVSNIFFGQGPWTPWQMLSYGLIGFFAGILFRQGRIRKTSLCVYGFLSVIFIFGGIMNLSAAVMYTSDLTWEGLLAMYMSGLPFDLVQAGSTVLFLAIGAKPMIAKLERIKSK